MGRPATHPRRGPTEWATVVPTVRTDVYACIHTSSYIRTHARANVRTCIHTHVHAYIQYMHTSSYKRTYVRTYIHTSTLLTIRTTSISWACDEAPPPGRRTAHRLHSTRPSGCAGLPRPRERRMAVRVRPPDVRQVQLSASSHTWLAPLRRRIHRGQSSVLRAAALLSEVAWSGST
jgi:hypothetical protein